MTMATLRVSGRDGQRAARVTEVLGIAPDEVVDRAGGRRPRPNSTRVWLLGSAGGPQDGVQLAASLQLLLDRVEPVADRLWALAAEGYLLTWWCYLGSRALEHAAVLDRVTLTRLLALPGELWLDVYPDDEDG